MRKNYMKILKILYNLFLIPILLLIVNYFWFAKLNNINLQVISLKSVMFNILFIDMLFIILLFLTKSSKKAYMFIIAFFVLVTLVNQYKIKYMNEPLYISDFNFLQNYKNISQFTGNSFLVVTKSVFRNSLFAFILYFVIFLMVFKFNICLNNRKLFISIFLIITLILFSFLESKFNSFFLKNIYSDSKKSLAEYYSYVSLYGYYGILGGINYQYLRTVKPSKPENYNKKSLEELETKSQFTSNEIDNANIVVILSESFFDLKKIEDNITFNKEITKNYNELKNKGQVVQVISPTFGGGTSNITFELLTATNTTFFDEGYFPFLDLYKDSKKRPSLVNELKNNGYDTSIILGADSYNSKNTMKDIGFSHFLLLKNKMQKGFYTSDDYLADVIIDKLKIKNKKKFIMVETMENHLPYPYSKFANYDIKVKDSNLTKEDERTLLSYAQGTYDADKMLKKIYDYIESSSENTILLFFGDHLPMLNNEKYESVYDKLTYFNTDDNLLNTFRKYNTESLILSNFTLNFDYSKYAGYETILNNLLNNMNLKVSPYFKWIYTTKDVIPTYNHIVAINEDMNICYLNDLNRKEKSILNLKNQMTYKEFIE